MKGLKTVLWVCAVVCLLSFVFAALPWGFIKGWFEFFGLKPFAAEPMTVYMFRLCLATYGLIGIFFVILARNPLKYDGMLFLAAYGALLTALFCLAGGIRYGLPFWAYGCDVIFCALAGVLLLIFRKKAMATKSS
jgi:hypothetical protein